MYTTLDMDSWERKEQFFFFKDYDNPFYNICTEVDVTELLNYTKEKNRSFFIASLYASLKAANLVKEFRYRIKGDSVIVYDKIHAGSTVLNDDETFGFCYFDYNEVLDTFNKKAEDSLKKHKDDKVEMESKENEDNLIHYSVVPWISFTSVSHARRFGGADSIPKIVFGKYTNKNGRIMMPVSIEVHHSLVDGLHVAKYLDQFQEVLNSLQELL